MSDVQQSLFLRALRREPVSRTPVWVMRQAGRYLPEYRKVRAGAGNFLNLCKNPDLACEVTLQPLRRFKLDAAILFSDILTIPDAMGLGLQFKEGEGPCFDRPLSTLKSISDLVIPDVESELAYVMNAVKTIRYHMPVELPLIGFSGSPWTLACYMVEGRNQHQFAALTTLIHDHPASAHELLTKLALSVSQYLIAQVDAGANALMIFDTWGGMLATTDYLEFSLAYMQTIVTTVKNKYPEVPIILFTKNGSHWLEDMANSGCDGLGLDWTGSLTQARARVGSKVALQGNLEPAILLQKPEIIEQEVKRVLREYGRGSGHIFNLGHGITPDINPDHLEVMINAVHRYSPAYHGSDKE